jgi:2-polyprenyl-6-methoxyphenol hydroxylase-like FAD-dependent oxidoreductase
MEFQTEDAALFKETSFISEKSGFSWYAPENPQKWSWTRLRKTSSRNMDLCSLFSGTPGVLGKMYFHNVRWRSFDVVAANSTFLIGDAAAVLDPGTGQGILLACWSAINAVDTIVQTLGGGITRAAASKTYNDWFNGFYHHRRKALEQHYSELGIDLT